jgi:hypothetical protein
MSLFGCVCWGASEINRLEDLEVKVLRETIAAAEIEKTIVEVRSTLTFTLISAHAALWGEKRRVREKAE